MSRGSSDLQRRPPVIPPGVHVCFIFKQHSHNLDVSPSRREVHGSTVVSDLCVHVGLALHELLHHFEVSMARCEVQRRPQHVSPHVHVGLVSQYHSNDICSSIGRRPV